MTSARRVELEKSRNMMQGDAIGATEYRNKLGMLVVMSLQHSVAFGGTETRFPENLQKVLYFKKIHHLGSSTL